MAFNFSPDKGTSEHYVIPAGTYAARLYAVVDLGHQWTQFLNKPGKWSRQIYIGFEIPELTFEAEDKVTGEKSIKPRVIGRQYTLSYYKESRLKALVQALIGRALTDEEQNKTGYPLETLVGKPCLISVIHKEGTKDGQPVTYANMDSIVAAPKGLTVPEQFNPAMLFCITEDEERIVYDKAVYDKLYQWLQDKIAKSREFTNPSAPDEQLSDDEPIQETSDTSVPFGSDEDEPKPEMFTWLDSTFTRADWLTRLHQAAAGRFDEPVDLDKMEHDDLQATGERMIKKYLALTAKKKVTA